MDKLLKELRTIKARYIITKRVYDRAFKDWDEQIMARYEDKYLNLEFDLVDKGTKYLCLKGIISKETRHHLLNEAIEKDPDIHVKTAALVLKYI